MLVERVKAVVRQVLCLAVVHEIVYGGYDGRTEEVGPAIDFGVVESRVKCDGACGKKENKKPNGKQGKRSKKSVSNPISHFSEIHRHKSYLFHKTGTILNAGTIR